MSHGQLHGRVDGSIRDRQAGMDLLVRRLVERGLIYRAGRGAYDFALPLFRDYIRRRAKLTELTRSVRSAAIGVDRAGDVG